MYNLLLNLFLRSACAFCNVLESVSIYGWLIVANLGYYGVRVEV